MAAETRDRLAVFGRLLRFWRTAFGLSQEELAGRAGISARHVSFLENGRTAASRASVLALAAGLGLGGRETAVLLLSAGFFPEAPALDLDDPAHAELRATLVLILRHADPFPSIVMDSCGEIRLVNRAWVFAHRHYIGDIAEGIGLNAMLLFLHEQGWRRFAPDWERIACVFLMMLQQEVIIRRDARASQLMARILRMPGVPADWARRGAQWSTEQGDYRLDLTGRDGRVHAFRVVHHTVGGTPYGGEERLIIQTVYPEAGSPVIERGWLERRADLTHPLCPY
jgi:transcriptional regulator with XRE-family HTH domain